MSTAALAQRPLLGLQALKKHPAGVKRRWDLVSQCVRTRTPAEVVKKMSALRRSLQAGKPQPQATGTTGAQPRACAGRPWTIAEQKQLEEAMRSVLAKKSDPSTPSMSQAQVRFARRRSLVPACNACCSAVGRHFQMCAGAHG